jgi:hypothetical protein
MSPDELCVAVVSFTIILPVSTPLHAFTCTYCKVSQTICANVTRTSERLPHMPACEECTGSARY